MAYVIDQRVESPISNLGHEEDVQAVVAKDSLWVSFRYFSGLYVREYEGYISKRLQENVINYVLTPAYDSDLNLNSNFFWMWVVDGSGVLTIYEMEPFTTSDPQVVRSKVILNDVSNVSVYTEEGQLHYVIVVYNDTAEAIFYKDPFDIEVLTQPLDFDGTYGTNVSGHLGTEGPYLYTVYTKTGSPLNVFYDEFQYPPIDNFIATNDIPYGATISWDAPEQTNGYTLERDTDPGFSAAVEIYAGTDTSYEDTPLTGDVTYYYRIRTYITYLAVSAWSEASVFIISVSISADFSGTPLTGNRGLSVQFSDQSTGVPTPPTSWLWDFGDGSTSTQQNPTHVYGSPGYYTVSLTAGSGVILDTETKINYVFVYPVPVSPIGFSPAAGPTLIFN